MENQIQDCRNHIKKIDRQIARLQSERENALKMIKFWGAGKCYSCENSGPTTDLVLCELANKNYPEQCDKRRFGDEG